MVKVNCLSINDDKEVIDARIKKKSFLTNRGTYRIQGFEVDVDVVLDEEFLEFKGAKKKEREHLFVGEVVWRRKTSPAMKGAFTTVQMKRKRMR